MRRLLEVQAPTLLLVDLVLYVEVDEDNDQVAGEVETAHEIQNIGFVKRNALGYLHHTQHDDEVGAGTLSVSVSYGSWRKEARTFGG